MSPKGNPPTNLPEAFPECPEIANQPVSLGVSSADFRAVLELLRAALGLKKLRKIRKEKPRKHKDK